MNFNNTKFIRRIKFYLNTYDPGFFSFIYSIRAIIALIISCLIAYIFLPPISMLWMLNAVINIFFTSSISGSEKQKVILLIFYTFACIVCIIFLDYFFRIGYWLFIPTFFWLMFVSLVGFFSQNLSRILTVQTLSVFILIVASENISTLDTSTMVVSYLVGCIISIAVRFISFGKYGLYTKRNFTILLNDLSFMVENFYNKDFDHWRQQSVMQIAAMKNIFAHSTSTYKDSALIKHQERALFYLYKTETILHCLNALRLFFQVRSDLGELKFLQDEILKNIGVLKGIFNGKSTHFSNDVYLKLKDNKDFVIVVSNLDILYHSFDMFIKGGQEKIALKSAKRLPSLGNFLKILNFNDSLFQYSFKFSLAVSISVFVAQYFKIDHGLWICVAVMAVMRANTNTVTIMTKDAIIGSIIGICVGVPLILIFKNSFLMHIFSVLSVFSIFYFRPFGYMIWSASLMFMLCMLFSYLRADFTNLLITRFFDMVIGFMLAVCISVVFWQKNSKDEIIPKIKMIFDDFKSLITNMILKSDANKFIALEANYFDNIQNLKILIFESKKQEFKPVLNAIDDINKSILNLRSYMMKYDFESDIVKNDLNVVLRLFDMIDKKIDALPSYFYDNVDEIFLCKDKKFIFLLTQIMQSEKIIYDFFNKGRE